MGLLDTIKSLLGMGSADRRSDEDVGVTVERDTRDSEEPQTETETAVKEPADEAVGDDADETEGTEEIEEVEDAVAAGTDASASTGSMVDETVDEPDEAAEPAEAVDAAAEAIDEAEGQPAPSAVSFSGQSATGTGQAVERQSSVEPDDAEEAVDEVDGDTVTDTDEVDADDTATEPAEAVDTDEGETVEAADDDATDASTASKNESPDVLKGIGPAYARRLADADIDTVADLAAADPEEVADAIDVSSKRVSRWITRAKEY